ncbi:MAG: thiamine pyrophosphate-dependent enzyme [Vulcanibacillus sp.]
MKNSDKKIENQKVGFLTGNEMAALSVAQINYHVMGYFPITPSTEIAEFLDEMKTRGEHDIQMIPADGEHGSAGINYGAATGGGRVFNATSANGFLYMLEQLPVQSGTRFPMLLNLVTRSVSGPLNIRGDHSDLYYALNTGWPILVAKDPQAVYDLNIIATRLTEHKDVRLPVIVAFDGFVTSHQKRKVNYFEDRTVVQDYVGEMPQGFATSLDAKNPVTIGGYMNDDYINNKYQQSLAMYEAGKVYKTLAEEYKNLSGREYKILDEYMMEDAEVAVFLLASAAETAKDVVDKLRGKGIKAGVISPNVIRPFPAEEIRKSLKNIKALLVGERGDSYGAYGGSLTQEVKAAIQTDKDNTTIVLSRIFSLGGKDFYPDEAEEFFNLAIDAVKKGYAEVPFDYFGVFEGNEENAPKRLLEPIKTEEWKTGLISVEKDPVTNKLKVKIPPIRALTKKPKRLSPGHGACPGCGIYSGLETFFKGIEGDIVVLFQTGCAMVVSTGYPFSSHKGTYIHNLFQNGAATLSGVVEMFWEKKRRGEINVSDDFTFIMVSGDGGMDIGMGPTIGAALRNHKMIIIEYDNEGYMNTGSQLSYSTPIGHMTTTSGVGEKQGGKSFHHKDTPQIMAATNIPYVFTGTEAYPQDLIKKAAKAQWYAQNEGLVYGKILISCPLNWKAKDHEGSKIVGKAVDSCFFPLYEVENGITQITFNPEEKEKRVPVSEWLGMLGKTKHLLKPKYAETLKEFEDEVELRWNRLKIKDENPLL